MSNRTLDIDVPETGNGYKFTAVVSIPIPCVLVGNDRLGDCAASGDTVLKRYYLAVQSWLPEEKNDITFDSHFATYLNAVGEEVSIDELGDKETARMRIVVRGNELFSDEAYFISYSAAQYELPADVVFAQRGAIIWAKEEDGCPE